MFWTYDKLKAAKNWFVESTDHEPLRGQKVRQFLIVLWLTWLFFAAFLWHRGYSTGAMICVGESLLLAIVNAVFRSTQEHRRITELNLAASTLGLLAVASSDPDIQGTLLFYPISILVASQLIGSRAAFSWFVITEIAFVCYFVKTFGWNDSIWTSKLDELVPYLGVGCCVYLCCQQGEAYYRQRTNNLIQLSRNLRIKSERLQLLATTDSLTGLANRFRFQECLKEAVESATKNSQPFTLFLIDMDGFKEINDTLGHAVGDDALVEIGKRLKNEFGNCSVVSRLGGDEFCIIYPNLGSEEQAEEVARIIGDILSDRYVLEEVEFLLGASVGYSMFPRHAKTDKDLLTFADTAMFHAKENQLGYASYDRPMTERLVEYRSVQEKLSRALELQEFFLVYQPQFNLTTGVVTGVEALLRWRHDVEIIPPCKFISHLERSREIIPVGRWIIREACRQLAQWNKDGFDIEVSINVSAIQFAAPDFFESVAAPIREFKLDPRKLDFEITEGLLIVDVPQTVSKLNQIKELGAKISVDDFGTGYSSLAYLRQFPIDRLKIDRAFIKDIPHADDGVIASSIIVLGKALGLNVIAEGVETEAHVQFLRDNDCEDYQGYFFSPPVPSDEVVKFFQTTCPSPAMPANPVL